MIVKFHIEWNSNNNFEAAGDNPIVSVADIGGWLLLEFPRIVEKIKTTTIILDIASLINSLAGKFLGDGAGNVMPIHIDGSALLFMRRTDRVVLYEFNPDLYDEKVNPVIDEISLMEASAISRVIFDEVMREISKNAPEIKGKFMEMII
ncbi:MAG: hypothetical protein WC804_22190 [Sphingomonas sp.]|jgi:hypothetical protein|uniref:hypothetical protein n=1 Tax=Sphingomonas sp. TaxID=28214 RepID=UPI003569ED02